MTPNQGDDRHDNAPTLPAYRYGRPLASGERPLKVWCDYCGAWHHHGHTGGHRVAHCTVASSPYRRTGYNLEPTTARAPARRARLVRLSDVPAPTFPLNVESAARGIAELLHSLDYLEQLVALSGDAAGSAVELTDSRLALRVLSYLVGLGAADVYCVRLRFRELAADRVDAALDELVALGIVAVRGAARGSDRIYWYLGKPLPGRSE